MLALRVDRRRAEELRHELSRLGLLDKSRKFKVENDQVEIPVLGLEGVDMNKWGAEVVEQSEPEHREDVYNPHEEIFEKVDIPSELVHLLPRKWELLGDILILKLSENLRPYEKEVARAYAEILGAETVLEDVGGILEEYRKPQVRLILGDRTETVHKENGVLFKLDTKEVMFSSGNIDERIRMAKICKKDDIVVDMFAGIGYFSIPMAVHSKPAEVYSIEINPVAFEYLCENVKLNDVDDIMCPLMGDCLEVAPDELATRVVMGYLSKGEVYLPKAMKVIGEEGIIHYHQSCPSELFPDKLISQVKDAAEKEDRNVEVLQQKVVKSYAPGVSHVVLDIRVS